MSEEEMIISLLKSTITALDTIQSPQYSNSEDNYPNRNIQYLADQVITKVKEKYPLSYEQADF
ncbi:hypothetical protein ACLMPP_21225 [Yersinia enterocolitica]|uniref:hypothetical protein n=1 Tax=Yersinia enterocolitica TaxID=630 RepID=UPI00398D242E